MFDVVDFQRRRRGKLGEELYCFERLESTNLTAEKLARNGIAEGTLVIAGTQTAGRGRKGRVWHSPPGVNLYCSLILRPRAQDLVYLPFLAGLAVVRSLKSFGLETDLKWPNDVLVNGKKICGVLIHTSMEENVLRFAVIGCGININETAFPAELETVATSILLETGASVSREAVLASFLLEFEKMYETVHDLDWRDFCRLLEQHSTMLRGCAVQIDQKDTIIEGTTQGLDAYGGLIVETKTGPRAVYAGEITACRKK